MLGSNHQTIALKGEVQSRGVLRTQSTFWDRQARSATGESSTASDAGSAAANGSLARSPGDVSGCRWRSAAPLQGRRPDKRLRRRLLQTRRIGRAAREMASTLPDVIGDAPCPTSNSLSPDFCERNCWRDGSTISVIVSKSRRAHIVTLQSDAAQRISAKASEAALEARPELEPGCEAFATPPRILSATGPTAVFRIIPACARS